MSRNPIVRGLATALLLIALIVLPATAQAAPQTGADSGWSVLNWIRTAWTAIWDYDDAGAGLDPL